MVRRGDYYISDEGKKVDKRCGGFDYNLVTN